MNKLLVLAASLLVVACSEDMSVEEYNKQQAERVNSKKPKGKVIKVETALPGGTKLACDQLFDAAQLTELLEEKDPVTIQDHTKKDVEATSVCSVRRGGKLMDMKKQKKLAEKTLKLGVLAGDELCNIAVYCSIPADDKQFKDSCKRDIEQGRMTSNEAIGAFSCIKVTPKGPHDAFTYRFIDPDSRCVMSVRGGPSVNEEADVQRCAKAAFELVGPESLEL